MATPIRGLVEDPFWCFPTFNEDTGAPPLGRRAMPQTFDLKMKTKPKLLYIAMLVVLAVVIIGLQLCPRESLPAATMSDLTQLPRPNSGTFTTHQAQARKGEIYGLKPTARLSDWEDPEFGTGFCVHITKDDEIEVDHYSMRFESNREQMVRDGVERITGERYIENPSGHHHDVTLAELEGMASMATTFNQPAFIVLTSERPAGQSKVFPRVLDCLFRPAIMLHYVPQTKRIEQGVGGQPATTPRVGD